MKFKDKELPYQKKIHPIKGEKNLTLIYSDSMTVFQDFGMCNMKLPQKRRFQVTETTETLTQSQYFKAFKLLISNWMC